MTGPEELFASDGHGELVDLGDRRQQRIMSCHAALLRAVLRPNLLVSSEHVNLVTEQDQAARFRVIDGGLSRD